MFNKTGTCKCLNCRSILLSIETVHTTYMFEVGKPVLGQ